MSGRVSIIQPGQNNNNKMDTNTISQTAGNVQTGKHTYAMFTFIQLDTHTFIGDIWPFGEAMCLEGKNRNQHKIKKNKIFVKFPPKINVAFKKQFRTYATDNIRYRVSVCVWLARENSILTPRWLINTLFEAKKNLRKNRVWNYKFIGENSSTVKRWKVTRKWERKDYSG